jgi:DNA-binding CsgD family transcriptional regulator
VNGHYSLLPREDSDGKRYYLLLSNATRARAHARLDGTEVDVVTYTARGYNGKSTAYALGISESRVSTALARAAEKLGLRSRAVLAEVASLLLGTKSVGAEGAFSKVSSIQRVATVGGIAPAGGCSEPGGVARVPYSADYYLFSAR